MNEDTKEEIRAILTLLKNSLISNGVSMGFIKDSDELFFFDTTAYLTNKEYKGFKIKIQELVK